MKAVIVAGLVGLFGLAVIPARLPAQQRALTSVDGFNGLPWGSPGAAIEQKHGAPVQTDSLDNGIVVLAYRDTLLDIPANTMYAVLTDHGLVKGQHTVKLDLEAGDCEAQYRRVRDHITFMFPLIAPAENTEYPFDLDFCEAVAEGVGVWATQWIDRSTRSIVTVVVDEGTDEVKVIFESGLFLDWLGVDLPPEDPDD